MMIEYEISRKYTDHRTYSRTIYVYKRCRINMLLSIIQFCDFMYEYSRNKYIYQQSSNPQNTHVSAVFHSNYKPAVCNQQQIFCYL